MVFPGPARAVLWVSAGRCDPQGEAELAGLGTVRAIDARSAEGSLATRSEPEPYQHLGGRGGRAPGTSRPRRVAVPPSAAIPHRD